MNFKIDSLKDFWNKKTARIKKLFRVLARFPIKEPAVLSTRIQQIQLTAFGMKGANYPIYQAKLIRTMCCQAKFPYIGFLEIVKLGCYFQKMLLKLSNLQTKSYFNGLRYENVFLKWLCFLFNIAVNQRCLLSR